MKQYVIAIGSEEISEKVQKALFSAGFEWEGGGGTKVAKRSAYFLYVNYGFNGTIVSGMYVSSAIMHIKDGIALLSAQEVIKNPSKLEGAKKPAKEMTVAEIQEKLGHDVKVIDG